VIVSPGSRWFVAEAPRPHLRLTFAGAAPAELVEGVRRLASAYGDA
jgi:DNA-binding transcriptional MocR family regulator